MQQTNISKIRTILNKLKRVLDIEKKAIENMHNYSILRAEKIKKILIAHLEKNILIQNIENEEKKDLINEMIEIIQKNKTNQKILTEAKEKISKDLWKMQKITKFIQ